MTESPAQRPDVHGPYNSSWTASIWPEPESQVEIMILDWLVKGDDVWQNVGHLQLNNPEKKMRKTRCYAFNRFYNYNI